MNDPTDRPMSYNDTSHLSYYYELICKEPLLTREKEKELIDTIYDKAGAYTSLQKKRAEEKLIKANLRFVFKKAKQYSKGDANMFEDLICAGNDGLLVSLEKFNPESGVRFLSYAGWWVFQRQMKAMSQMRIVSLPIWKQQLAKKIAVEQEKLGRPLTDEELQAKFPTKKLKDLKDLATSKYLTYYIDDMLGESEFCKDLEELIFEEMDRDDLYGSINSLPSPMKEVIQLSFGFDNGKEKSAKEVSVALNIKPDEVKKLKAEGVLRLKKLVIEE